MSEVPAYRDPERDADSRLKDLLGRMTLEEKLAQLGGVRAGELAGAEGFDEAAAERWLAHGIGHVGRIAGTSGLTPASSARFANAVQRHLLEKTRLGVPAIVHEEALAGFCARGATQYPQAIGLAATWAPEDVRAMAAAIAAEMRAVGARQALAPVLDIARDPRWGRLEETFGEDPYLAGRMGVAYVRGLQGAGLQSGVVATARHFVGHGLPEGGMNRAPVQLGPRELREVFAEPFAAAVRDANLRSVMCAHSAVDGLPPAASPELLEELLRGELGFEGLVVSDYGAVELLVRHHRVARDAGDAALQALTAGVDVELPALECYGEPLKALIEAGKVEMTAVDRAVRRVLRVKLELGLFEAPYVDEAAAAALFDAPASRALAGRLAERSMVLLKNDGLLPLRPGCRLALLGPTADDPRLLLGDYHYPVLAEGEFRADEAAGPRAAAGADGFAPGPYYVPVPTPRQALGERAEVLFHPGCGITGGDGGELADAVAVARRADVAVICVGGKSGNLPDCTSGEFRDAADLRLTGLQSRLVAEVAATGVPVVLVVIGGRAFSLAQEVEAANAAVMAWLPGEEGGTALARVLFGEANPAGRLPVSLPRAAGQVPVHYAHRAGGGRSSILGDYVDQPTRPLFPFGHGLSYASFEYHDLVCPHTVDVHATVNVWVTVRNVSAVDGDEVVQVYVHDRVADVARPVRKLVGFKRVTMAAGAECRLKFVVDASQLGYYDRRMRFVVEPGEVEVMVGASSRDIRLRSTVTLKGERRPLQQQQVLATQVEVVESREARP